MPIPEPDAALLERFLTPARAASTAIADSTQQDRRNASGELEVRPAAQIEEALEAVCTRRGALTVCIGDDGGSAARRRVPAAPVSGRP